MAASVDQKAVFDNTAFTDMFKLSEKTTGYFAEALIKQSGLPSSSLDKLVVLDNACGTGIVTTKLIEGDFLSEASRAKLDITCADYSETMINYTKEKAATSGWDNVRTVLADAMDTKLPSSEYTHVLWNFGPSLLKDSLAGIRECKRMLQPDGVLGVTAWEYVPWVEEFRPAFERHPEFPPYIKPGQLQSLFSETPATWNTADDMKAHLENTGFVDVNVERVTFAMTWSLEESILPIPGLIQLFSWKLWTQEQRDAFTEPVAKAMEEVMRERHGGKPLIKEFKAMVGTGRNP